ELPVFVSVGAEPVTAVVVPLVREANGDAIAVHRPELLDQTVVQLPGPLAPQELHDGLTAVNELGPIPPYAVDRVCERHAFRVTAVPGVFREPDLLDCGIAVERRSRGVELLGFHRRLSFKSSPQEQLPDHVQTPA